MSHVRDRRRKQWFSLEVRDDCSGYSRRCVERLPTSDVGRKIEMVVFAVKRDVDVRRQQCVTFRGSRSRLMAERSMAGYYAIVPSLRTVVIVACPCFGRRGR
jgi:hypothetical protein